MQHKLQVKVEYQNVHSHLTQDDIFGLKHSLKTLFVENPSYLRAICHLLIRDYICLGYEFPGPCADMNKWGNII